jgi:predicted nucleic acid-binding Zn ribbon protein
VFQEVRAIPYTASVKKPSLSPTARRADVIPLKEGLEALVRAYRLGGKLNEVTVVASWERVMGKAVALKTKEVYVSKGKLFVRLTSAPLKYELVMAKTRVLEMLNAEVGAQAVTEVVFL